MLSEPRKSPPRHGRWRSAGLAVLLLLGAAALTGSTQAPGEALPGGSLRVDAAGCGTPPAHLPAGRLSFAVTNGDKVFASIYVVSPDGSLAYAEIPWLGPNKTLPLATTLTGGDYAIRCVFSNGTVRTSRTVRVSGTATGAVAGYRPLSDLEMTGPVKAYRAYVTAAFPGLLAATRTLEADLARGDLAAAKTDWLTAHLEYERLGAAYHSFGEYDDAINGMANGLPQGVDSPQWTGFFALEHGLWHGAPVSRLQQLGRRLVADIVSLQQDFPSEDTDPGDLSLRAHEILENALQFQLGGIADYGSGTTLATLSANIRGTQEVLSVLAPVLSPRDPELLSQLNQQLAAYSTEVTSHRSASGVWTPVTRLDASQRRRLDGDLGHLLEELAAVPNLLTPRNHA
ncbi:EfeM/EfeO family lipoprotein [Streptomyces sp. RB6PN23]|uniref:EfeM/EfeO family lipoprotein n=1 Tax=Streptomyces silvisoli TaxID=3034235 RepID=A0ABT5ZP65_9ACTN|nr:EfeM/EfeO family lipoprotein [Streptomyces silvisoli]